MNYEQQAQQIINHILLDGMITQSRTRRGFDESENLERRKLQATQAILSLLNQVRAEERKQVAKLMKQGLDNLPRLEQLIREAKIEGINIALANIITYYGESVPPLPLLDMLSQNITELKAEAEL